MEGLTKNVLFIKFRSVKDSKKKKRNFCRINFRKKKLPRYTTSFLSNEVRQKLPIIITMKAMITIGSGNYIKYCLILCRFLK